MSSPCYRPWKTIIADETMTINSDNTASAASGPELTARQKSLAAEKKKKEEEKAAQSQHLQKEEKKAEAARKKKEEKKAKKSQQACENTQNSSLSG